MGCAVQLCGCSALGHPSPSLNRVRGQVRGAGCRVQSGGRSPVCRACRGRPSLLLAPVLPVGWGSRVEQRCFPWPQTPGPSSPWAAPGPAPSFRPPGGSPGSYSSFQFIVKKHFAGEPAPHGPSRPLRDSHSSAPPSRVPARVAVLCLSSLVPVPSSPEASRAGASVPVMERILRGGRASPGRGARPLSCLDGETGALLQGPALWAQTED